MADLLKTVYYDPASEGSFGGKNRLKEAVFNTTGVKLPDRQVSEWLAGEESYTLHKAARVNYKRNRIRMVMVFVRSRDGELGQQ